MGPAGWVARHRIPIAAILMPAGFFFSSMGAGRTEPNGLSPCSGWARCSSRPARSPSASWCSPPLTTETGPGPRRPRWTGAFDGPREVTRADAEHFAATSEDRPVGHELGPVGTEGEAAGRRVSAPGTTSVRLPCGRPGSACPVSGRPARARWPRAATPAAGPAVERQVDRCS